MERPPRREFPASAEALNDRKTLTRQYHTKHNAHVAHDCIIEDGTTLSVGAIILGHVHVMRESNCGSGCQIHQHQVVGTWSMIGMGAVIPKKVRVEPGKVWVGNPAKELKTNDYLMRQVSVDSHRYEAKRFLELVEQHEL